MIKNLPSSLKKAIGESPLIIGVGPTAWPRMLSSFYFPKFKTISYYDTQDNDLIEKQGVEVFSIKKNDPYIELSPVTPGNILELPITKKYLDSQKEPFVLLVYKSFGKLEKIVKKNGWKFLGNKKDIIDTYENKRIFKETLREIGIEPIPGENLLIDDLTKEKFVEFQKKLGQKKLVLQLAEITYGGGSGTLFIDNPDKISAFHKRVKELRDTLGSKKEIKTVNVAPFIEGTTTSIACCTTKFGVLTGSIQNQIVDIADVGAVLSDRSGNFAGHDWAFKHYPEECQIQAVRIAERFGDFLYKKGFKGIFGLDLIVDKKQKVWPVECNPRETDAFPLICMLQMENGSVPMQVIHNLEHLGIDYKLDFDELNKSYKIKYNASQILLYNKSENSAIDREVFKAGVYCVRNGKLVYLRSGFMLSDLKDENEFLFTEDISKKAGKTFKPHERIFRLIKRGGVLETQDSLKSSVREVVGLVYKKIELMDVENGMVTTNGFREYFSNRLVDLKNVDFESIEILNIISDTGKGIRRPVKVAWRKKITDEPILDQIPSKRARKQIKTDIKKLGVLEIKMKIIEDLDEKTFLDWLEIYKKIISEKRHGHVAIDESWLEKKKNLNKKVAGTFIYKDDVLVGGQLLTEVKGILGVGFSASKRLEGLAGSLTLLMDYGFLEYAQKKGYKEVSFGQDTNLYGKALSTGLISYKLKLGFLPQPANKTYWVSSYFINISKFKEPIMFFGGESSKLELIIITDKKEDLDLNMYSFLDSDLIKVYGSSGLQSQHNKLI